MPAEHGLVSRIAWFARRIGHLSLFKPRPDSALSARLEAGQAAVPRRFGPVWASLPTSGGQFGHPEDVVGAGGEFEAANAEQGLEDQGPQQPLRRDCRAALARIHARKARRKRSQSLVRHRAKTADRVVRGDSLVERDRRQQLLLPRFESVHTLQTRSDRLFQQALILALLALSCSSRAERREGVQFGSLRLRSGAGELTVAAKAHSVALDVNGELPCVPAWDRQRRRLYVGTGNEVIAFDDSARVLWSVAEEYSYDPNRIVATNHAVLFATGPLGVGSPEAYKSRPEWKRTFDRSVRVAAYSANNGNCLWSKPLTLVGSPLCAFGPEVLGLAPCSRKGRTNSKRSWCLVVVNARNGEVDGRFVVKRVSVGVDRTLDSSVPEFLVSPAVVFHTQEVRGELVATAREAQDVGALKLAEIPQGVRIRIAGNTSAGFHLAIRRGRRQITYVLKSDRA